VTVPRHYDIDDDDLDALDDKALLWMIHRDLAETRRHVRNISAIVTAVFVLALIRWVLAVIGMATA